MYNKPLNCAQEVHNPDGVVINRLVFNQAKNHILFSCEGITFSSLQQRTHPYNPIFFKTVPTLASLHPNKGKHKTASSCHSCNNYRR